MSEKDHKKLQKKVKAKNKERRKAASGKKMSGKGDTPRPMDLDKFRDNFDKIFRGDAIEDLLKKEGGEEVLKSVAEDFQKHTRRVKVVKKYVDGNNTTKYVININDNLTNKTVTEAQYLSLINESNRDDIIDVEGKSSFPSGNDVDFGTSME